MGMGNGEWIDASMTLRSGMLHWPGDPPVVIERVRDMEKGETSNLSRMAMGVHSGTHVDAPVHFINRAKGIDRLPFDPLIGLTRVLAVAAVESVQEADLAECGIETGERILLRTDNSIRQNLLKTVFDDRFIHLEEDAARFLATRKIKTVGVDYLSVGGYQKNGSAIHRILLEADIVIIEGLDLAGVRPGYYDMICLPMRIQDADGAPARVVLRERPDSAEG